MEDEKLEQKLVDELAKEFAEFEEDEYEYDSRTTDRIYLDLWGYPGEDDCEAFFY